MSEIAKGYSYYKFDIVGWLTSPDVQKMDLAERGMYHHMITIQSRDDTLSVGIRELSLQLGQDRRSVKRWMKKWGFLFPIIDIPPDTLMASTLRTRCVHVTSMQPVCNECVAPALPLRCFPAASMLRAGNVRANPKQWNLSVKSGKLDALPLLEERRGELDVEGEEDKTMCYFPIKPKATPKAKGEGA